METLQQEIDKKIRLLLFRSKSCKRIDENHYRIKIDDDIVDVRREINYNFKAVLSIVINDYGFFSGISFDDDLIQTWLAIVESSCTHRSLKCNRAKKKNRTLWDSLTEKKAV